MAESKIAVYGAIASNVAIAAVKYTVAGITGSSAMLSEAIHSTVDTGNGVLLLVGNRLARRKATPEHPFGHGKELYFWGLIVAMLIFGVGGGVSAYEGIVRVLDPTPMRDPFWNYIVLGAAALMEGASFFVALRQFRKENRGTPFWEALHRSKDPTTYTVLAEDTAAVAGVGVAAVGIYAAHRFDIPELDGAASIVIGLLLAAVAVFLILESRGLLIGEGVRPETARAVRELAAATPGVRSAAWPLSMYIGPTEVLLTLDVTFDPDVSAADVAAAIHGLEKAIRERYPNIKRIYVEAVPHSTEAGRGAPAQRDEAQSAGYGPATL